MVTLFSKKVIGESGNDSIPDENDVISEQKGNSVTYQETVMTKDPSDVSPENEDFMQRLWAYLTVKQLLERQVLLKGQEKEDEKKEALKLSLKYQFVTSLTSMVVTKPQEGEVEVANKPKEGGEEARPPGFYPSSRNPPASPGRKHFGYSYGQGRQLHLKIQPVPAAAHPGFHDLGFAQRPMIPRQSDTVLVTMSVPTVSSNRFLLPTAGQSKPLCFDVPVPHKLKLLQDSASEFSMNGELMARRKGFREIAFHFKTNHHLTINTRSIRYQDGQNHVEFLWNQAPTQHNTESMSLILRSNEVDVTMGNIRVVILLHKKNGEVFLWPAVKQQPKDVSLMGILGKAEASYEEVQGSQTPTLKIMDQEVKASLEDVTDYTLPSTPVIRCWLVPFQAVMQKDISDFTVTQL